MVGLVFMIESVFTALIKAGIPVALASYGLVWWALRNDYLDSVVSIKDLEKQIKQQSKDKKNRKPTDLLHKKWLTFGGGFYGVVALLTAVIIELQEIWQFLTQFDGFIAFFTEMSLDKVIGLIINSLMNLLYALAWPWYWVMNYSGSDSWIALLVAYGGYWAGTRLAIEQHSRAGQAGTL